MNEINTSTEEVQRKLLIQILTNKLDGRQYNLTEEVLKILQLRNNSSFSTTTTTITSSSNGSNTGLVKNKEAVILIFIFVLWIYSIGRMFFVWRDILNFSAEQQPILSWSSLMEYLRSLKKPAMEAGMEAGSDVENMRREMESSHTVEEFNSIEEQIIPNKLDTAISEQKNYGLTSKGFMCDGLNSSLAAPNNEVVHIVASGCPHPAVGNSQPCRPKRAQENCSGGNFNPGSRQSPVLECRNPSCDCKTVTC